MAKRNGREGMARGRDGAGADGAHRGGIGLGEYRSRRERLLRELKGAVGIVFAGEGAAPLLGVWRPDTSFEYLTGIADEPGASVLFDPGAEDPKRRCVLFLRPMNPELEAWDGHRETIGAALRARHGFETVQRTTYLPRSLTAAARRAKRLACLHSFGVYDGAVSADLSVFRKVMERVVGCAVEDRTGLIPGMRSRKSVAELAVMRRAIVATAAGFERVARTLAPGVREGELARAFENAIAEHGAQGVAYNTIAGSGKNATVLHYNANRERCRAGDLVVVDAGARVDGYCADITRTYPVSGRFTARQRELYDLVLEAQLAAIRGVRPGARMHEVDEAARRVLRRGGVEDKYIHGIGHHLGVEVHDATPDGALSAGMVVTIEPGVYLPEEGLGIRIEDDVLVTSAGRRVLSPEIAKRAAEVEALVQGRRGKA